MEIVYRVKSHDNMAIKYIQATDDNDYNIETTYVDHPNKHIICFSSQIGCCMGCKICYTGLMSQFYRNLSAEELYQQCKNIVDDLGLSTSKKPILFSCMGVGEPLLNHFGVHDAMLELSMCYPGNKFSMATMGINPRLIKNRLADVFKDISPFKLMVSLHAPDDKTREKIIPQGGPVFELIEACKRYEEASGQKIEWNYILLKGINDGEKKALALARILGSGEVVKINAYNSVRGDIFKPSAEETRKKFMDILNQNGIITEYYETNGADVFGACGQLVSSKVPIKRINFGKKTSIN